MRLIFEINISVKKGSLPDLIHKLTRGGCEIQRLGLTEMAGGEETYTIEAVYHKSEGFNEFISEISASDERFRTISVRNSLQDKISGGLLSFSSRLPLENMSDYLTGLIGGHDLIQEKISEGKGSEFAGVARSVGLVSGVRTGDESKIKEILSRYSSAEKDSVLINRFTGLNAFPVVIRCDQPEDFLKHLKSIESNFSAVRIFDVDGADMMTYGQIMSGINIPVLSRMLDDIPAYLLALAGRVVSKNKLIWKELTAGVVGIDVSTIRASVLLAKLGCRRVLGYENNEKYMLSFENFGGLATTTVNIFENADIIFLLKRNFDRSELANLRPGQYLISMFELEDSELKIIKDRGIREVIRGDIESLSMIFPGVLMGLVKSGKSSFNDSMVLGLSKKIEGMLGPQYRLPDVFSGIHDEIAEAVSSEI